MSHRSKKYSLEEIKIIFNNIGFIPDNGWIYINCQIPIHGTWIKCGHKTSPRLTGLINQKYKCKLCVHRIKNGQGLNRYFYTIQKRAKRKNFKFDLTKEEVYKIIIQNCKFCDTKPNMVPGLTCTVKKFHKENYSKERIEELSLHASQFKCNSLDRIDSNKGYELNNIQALCKECNERKSNSTDEEFLKHCIRVAKFQNKKESL